jgi:hypothetical protein
MPSVLRCGGARVGACRRADAAEQREMLVPAVLGE